MASVRTIRFFTLVYQEMYRFARLVKQTVYPPILNTLLFIVIFGFSLGGQINAVHGHSYILYIIPGLAAMGVMNNSFSNTSTSLHMGRFDQSIDNLISTPVRPIELVSAYVIGGIARGLLIGTITLAVSLLLLQESLFSFGWTLYFIIVPSILFGCWGIISGLQAKTWDNLATTQTFIITPLTYLGGTFFSIHHLPPFWQKVALCNPLFYMIDGMRYGVLGVQDTSLLLCASMTALIALTLFCICVWLFQRGYRLVR